MRSDLAKSTRSSAPPCSSSFLFADLPPHSSEYQNLPLHSLDELRQLAAQENPPVGLQVPLPAGDTEESAHELMLVRLAFELAERKRFVPFFLRFVVDGIAFLCADLSLTVSVRFEEERKELGVVKTKLIKENEVKKARLEELEKQLNEFISVRFASFPPTPFFPLRNFTHRLLLRPQKGKAIEAKMQEEPTAI